MFSVLPVSLFSGAKSLFYFFISAIKLYPTVWFLLWPLFLPLPFDGDRLGLAYADPYLALLKFTVPTASAAGDSPSTNMLIHSHRKAAPTENFDTVYGLNLPVFSTAFVINLISLNCFDDN